MAKGEGLAWKVLGLTAAIAAGIAAKKVATTAWKRSTGTPPPANPEDPDVTFAQAVAWAVVTGAAVGVARMYASRKLAKYWRKSTGHLPPGVQEVS
ncbi:MAG TPA: DUF4235 domain-containing protein [Jiangellales bacterium]|nr:DUF4235 domain-containing protein [Jiangellales bacterium]